MDTPGKVANPASGQLNRENNISLSAFVPAHLVSRDGSSSSVPRQPAHLHAQAESGAYLPGFLPSSAAASIYETAICHRVSLEFIGSRNCVPVSFTAESPPAPTSKPQGSSKRVLPWQVTMDQSIFASLSHTCVVSNHMSLEIFPKQ